MAFQLPIYYNGKKREISEDIHNNLELTETIDPSQQPIYKYLFSPKTELGVTCLERWKKYYTTDIKFLKDTQKLVKSLKKNEVDKKVIETAWDDWDKIKNEDNFLEKYQYIEWERIGWLNNSSTFLTVISYYNLTSPVVNLILPILMLFVPFFFLKMMKIPVTFKTYKRLLFSQLKNHIIGRLFTEFNNVKLSQKIYMLFSFGMYIFNFYQNIVSCYKFYKNLHCVNEIFLNMNTYVKYTLGQFDLVMRKIKKLKTYSIFKQKMHMHTLYLQKFYANIKVISSTPISILKISQLGYMMKYYYALYADKKLSESLLFSFNFNGYLDTIEGLNKNISEGYVNKTKYIKEGFNMMENMYHPSLMYKKPVKNNLRLNKNKIITGPNAAGKTTLIKSSLLNILSSQQIGFGYYSKAEICPFDNFHCYLNIPDTSGRDSLFQAEAKRCKKILDNIEKNPKESHFCIFDELFSGTNPYEAIGSAFSYLDYISKNRNVKFMLTTHYIKLCKICKKNKEIQNYNMETFLQKDYQKYTYKLISGISTIKGGICVLRDLKFPSVILKLTQKTIKKL
jgi:DNA mismatch repair ATPase MutS